MRTTLAIEDDAFFVVKHLAQREKISLGEAVSTLIREGARSLYGPLPERTLRGRFALLPVRDEVITTEHVRELMEREGI